MLRRRGLGIARPAARTAARTAVIAGTATAVSGRVARRQQHKAANGQPAPTDGAELVERLRQLADLHASGALSEKEFAAAKAKLLAL